MGVAVWAIHGKTPLHLKDGAQSFTDLSKIKGGFLGDEIVPTKLVVGDSFGLPVGEAAAARRKE